MHTGCIACRPVYQAQCKRHAATPSGNDAGNSGACELSERTCCTGGLFATHVATTSAALHRTPGWGLSSSSSSVVRPPILCRSGAQETMQPKCSERQQPIAGTVHLSRQVGVRLGACASLLQLHMQPPPAPHCSGWRPCSALPTQRKSPCTQALRPIMRASHACVHAWPIITSCVID